AMLRLWLSLAVDADEAVPLPNLDFKIETGDSLLAPDPHEMPDLFRARLQQSADVLTMVKHQFLVSHGLEKLEYRKTMVNEEARLRRELSAEYGAAIVDWRIQFAEAFANKRGGFNIVLANPPYVRMELFKDIKPQLRINFEAVHTDRADLYVYFYARAIQLLAPHGEADRRSIAQLALKCDEARGNGCEKYEAEIDRSVARLYGIDAGKFTIRRDG
ncbi:MAG: Eco57I restriction-modification methylase domain-containing protein, partial [Pirellulales bacterium]